MCAKTLEISALATLTSLFAANKAVNVLVHSFFLYRITFTYNNFRLNLNNNN